MLSWQNNIETKSMLFLNTHRKAPFGHILHSMLAQSIDHRMSHPRHTMTMPKMTSAPPSRPPITPPTMPATLDFLPLLPLLAGGEGTTSVGEGDTPGGGGE